MDNKETVRRLFYSGKQMGDRAKSLMEFARCGAWIGLALTPIGLLTPGITVSLTACAISLAAFVPMLISSVMFNIAIRRLNKVQRMLDR